MSTITEPLLAAYTWAFVRVTTRPRDRGDVPGWVLITIMTAGLVAVLWKFAGPKLREMLGTSLDEVSGPTG